MTSIGSRIFIIGGYTGGIYDNSVFVFNTNNNSWEDITVKVSTQPGYLYLPLTYYQYHHYSYLRAAPIIRVIFLLGEPLVVAVW